MEVVSLIFFIFALICLLIVLFLMNSYSRRIEKIAVIFACCGLFSFGAGIILRPSQQEDNQYTITAVTEGINYLKTKDGNIWRVNKDLEVGKEYEVKFDSKGTNNVIDDEILEIK